MEIGVAPHNKEAEQGILVGLLLDKEAIVPTSAVLVPADFYFPRHALIYGAMLKIRERGEPVDFVTVSDELTRENIAEQTGGQEYLHEILESTPASPNIDAYIAIIKRTATCRALIGACGKIASLAYDDALGLQEILETSQSILGQITKQQAEGSFITLADLLIEYLSEIPAGGVKTDTGSIDSGYGDLDLLLGGFQPSDLIILGARPGAGKTAISLNFARNAALHLEKPVAMFSLEMSRRQLTQRFLSMESGIDSMRIRGGSLTSGEIDTLSQAVDQLGTMDILIDDTPGVGINMLCAKAKRLHDEHPYGLLIIDYVQLIKGSNPRDNRVQEVSQVSMLLKQLARELNIPILALCQLNRSVENRADHIPMLSDLRESGSLEQDADVVIFLHRPDLYDKGADQKGIVELHIAKHRNGPVGKISLLFSEKTTRFMSLYHGGAVD